MSKVKSLMCVLALTFFLAGSLTAQDTSSSSSSGTQNQTYDNMQGQAQNETPQKELATDLQARINLNEEQTQQVQDILTEYQSSAASTQEETSSEAETNANDKIASLLDDNQKASFESVKSDWWNNVKEKLSQNGGDQMDNDGSMDHDKSKDQNDNGTNDNGTNDQGTQGTQPDTTSY